MAEKKRGLGRGLDTIFVDNAVDNGNATVVLKLNDIEPNKEQPRRVFNEDALSELAQSISEHGVIQPLLVRPLADGSYQLVAGERRWRAARMAGLSEVPVVVREMSDSDAMALALIENLQREDLNPVEEALGLKKLMDELAITQDEAAQRVGKSRPAVANALRLLKLPAEVLDLVSAGELSAGHARTLVPLDESALQIGTAKEVIRQGLSVRQTEKLVGELTKPKKERSAKPKKRDTFIEEAELALARQLGRKVAVRGGEKGGKLEIEFFSKEDLTKLLSVFEEN